MRNQFQNKNNNEEQFDFRIPRSSDFLNHNGNVDFDRFHPINREKREMVYSPPPCNFKRCAFDMPEVNRNATTAAKQTSETAILQRPASCEDLKLIGHGLSGFYLVSKYLNFTMQIIVQIETNNLILVF